MFEQRKRRHQLFAAVANLPELAQLYPKVVARLEGCLSKVAVREGVMWNEAKRQVARIEGRGARVSKHINSSPG